MDAKTLWTSFHLWRRSTRGATAIEYAMIAAGISMAIAAIVFTIGGDIFVGMYQKLADTLETHL